MSFRWIQVVLAALLLLLGGGAVRAEVATIRDASGAAAVASGRVSFTVAPGLEDAAARLAPEAARFLADIETDLAGLPRVERVEVRLVKHSADLATAAPPGHGAPAWAAGVAWPDTGIVAVAARGPDGSLVDMDKTLAHELAHMAIERALGDGAVPRWLHEGFAWQHSSDFTMERAQTLAAAAFTGHLIELRDLDARFPSQEREVDLAYAQSYDFVGFLANRGRWQDLDDDGDRWAFQQFLAGIARGQGVNDAALAAYGRPLAALEAEWIESVRARFVWYPVAALGGFFWVLLGVLAVFGWRRRRRQKRQRLEDMEIEELLAEAARRRAHEQALAARASLVDPAQRGVDG